MHGAPSEKGTLENKLAKCPARRAQRVAAHGRFSGSVAEVAQSSQGDQGAFRIETVTAAIDCGINRLQTEPPW
jgi:hypothetical protein